MKNHELGEMFRKVVKGKNFMTDEILRYEEIKDGVCEISKGEFLDRTLYGVTVVKDNKLNTELSKCLHSIKEVNEYVNKLKTLKL